MPSKVRTMRSPGAQEIKSTSGWQGAGEGLAGPTGAPFLLPSPLQGATVSLSETVQKWREYRRQCQRNLTETPAPATGECRWGPASSQKASMDPECMAGHGFLSGTPHAPCASVPGWSCPLSRMPSVHFPPVPNPQVLDGQLRLFLPQGCCCVWPFPTHLVSSGQLFLSCLICPVWSLLPLV